MANIKNVIRGLGVDHLTVLPSYDLMKGIMGASISPDLHSPKALERASAMCTSCISLIRNIAFRMAIEQEIPFAVFGLSPGQAPLKTSVVKVNPRMTRATQDRQLKHMRDLVGEDVRRLFLEERHFKAEDDFPYSINPLAFVEYDETVIYESIQQYGWKKPSDTDVNSTNCRLNAVANHLHIKQFGYNPYAYEIAEMVRSGRLSREEGLGRMAPEEQGAQVTAILEELEIGYES
jgi:tRNA(Ile)-lysidine synthase TilS/MesJ